jgi:hypothetical protein
MIFHYTIVHFLCQEKGMGEKGRKIQIFVAI